MPPRPAWFQPTFENTYKQSSIEIFQELLVQPDNLNLLCFVVQIPGRHGDLPLQKYLKVSSSLSKDELKNLYKERRRAWDN